MSYGEYTFQNDVMEKILRKNAKRDGLIIRGDRAIKMLSKTRRMVTDMKRGTIAVEDFREKTLQTTTNPCPVCGLRVDGCNPISGNCPKCGEPKCSTCNTGWEEPCKICREESLTATLTKPANAK